MKYLYILLFVVLGIQADAQEFYITTYEYFSHLNTIKLVDSNFNVTPLTAIYTDNDQIWDIAIAPDGKFYGTLTDSLIEIDIPNGTYNVVYQFPVPGLYNSLVCNSDNQILALEYNEMHLVTIDLTTFTEVSNVVLNESTPGDLTFYKGNLIFPSTSSNEILSYNGNGIKTVACAAKYSDGEDVAFWGFSNYMDSCDNNFVYGFDQYGFIYRFDIESNTNEVVGNLQLYLEPLNGTTTVNEYSASACPFMELDAVDCSLKITDEQLSNLLFYPNPVKDILHVENLNMEEQLFFTLYSMDGRKLVEDLLTPEMDFSRFYPGIYFMEIYNKSRTLSTSKKILKN